MRKLRVCSDRRGGPSWAAHTADKKNRKHESAGAARGDATGTDTLLPHFFTLPHVVGLVVWSGLFAHVDGNALATLDVATVSSVDSSIVTFASCTLP